MMTIRRIAALVLAMALIMSFASALADDPAEYPAAKSETVAKLLEIQEGSSLPAKGTDPLCEALERHHYDISRQQEYNS